MDKTTGAAAISQKTPRVVVPPLLSWSFIILLAALAILEMRGPKPIPATAPQAEFSAERALTHVRVIARIPHPLGTEANAAVRDYLVSQLSSLGLNPQVTAEAGIHNGARQVIIADTHNIAGRLPGTASSGAIMLIAHYDSVYRAPGAADDGASLAAILESIRALRARPALKNDLIVLFTDGEEAGLLGADAFAASHSWMKDVGLILNFEARGNQGPSLLFETSTSNSALIKAVAQASPYPIGSSLFYSLYKLLPNDTDFTVFRPYNIPGLNFAFGENLEAYHSRLDTSENLSASSLQHQGSYALSLTQYFGGVDLTRLRSQNGDDVFFDWFGSSFVAYREGWVIPGQVLVTILLAFTILLNIRRSGVKLTRVFLALVPSVIILIGVPALMTLVEWLLSRLLAAHMILSDSRANGFLLIGLVLLGACLGTLLLAYFRGRFTIPELSLAGLILVCVMSWALALELPAGSYLLFWPLLLATLGSLLIGLLSQGAQPRAQGLAGIAGTAATVLLFAPIIYLLYIFLTLQLITIVAIGFLLGLFFITCVSFVNMGIPQKRWPVVVLILFVCAVTMAGIGARLSVYSSEHPRHDSILYSLNADDHSAVWISYDHSVDAWTAQFFSNKQPLRQPMPNYLNGSQWPVLSAPTSPLEMSPPVADIRSDEDQGDLRKIRLNLRSQRNANILVLTFSEAVQPLSLRFATRNIAVRPNASSFSIILLGMGAQGADLDLTLKAPSGISFWLMDRSFGLPTKPPPRPDEFIATEGSDETLICRKYSL